jgi:hypothetical protein
MWDRPFFVLGCLHIKSEARGGAVGWVTALQTRRSRFQFPMMSKFFIDKRTLRWDIPRCVEPKLINSKSTVKTQLYYNYNIVVFWLYFCHLLILTREMSTRNISLGDRQPYHIHVPIAMKFEFLNVLETSGSLQACDGVVLPCTVHITLNNASF